MAVFDQTVLENGLVLVGDRLPHVRSCTVGCWVRVGSMNELPEENGLTHMVEHMVFKGTSSRSARDIAEEMDMVGGQINAFTGKDCTCYYAKVMDGDLPLAVDILSDLALNPLFEESEFQKERGVVLEEIAMVEDTPEDLAHELHAEVQFSGSLRRPILGTKEQIMAYSRDTLMGYWKQRYVPGSMVMSIAGNYNWDLFVELCRTRFGAAEGVPPGPSHGAQAVVSGRKAREKDTEQVHICLGYPGLPLGDEDLFPLSVFSIVLGGGMSSRLFQRIREELGLAYGIYSFISSYPGCGVLNVYAGASPDNAEKVVAEIQSIMKALLRDGMTDKEFTCGKAQMRGAYVLGLESSSARMQTIGRNMLLQNRLYDPDERLRKIDGITRQDVRRVGEKVLLSIPSAAVLGKGAERFIKQVGGIANG